MPVAVTTEDIVLRLLAAVLAGALVGFDRVQELLRLPEVTAVAWSPQDPDQHE